MSAAFGPQYTITINDVSTYREFTDALKVIRLARAFVDAVEEYGYLSDEAQTASYALKDVVLYPAEGNE